MKLTLAHADILAGICALLESKGMTAFSPEVVEAKFSVSRKDGTLSVELDTDPAPQEEKASATPQAEKPAAAAQQSATKGGEQAAPEAKPNDEPKPEVAAEEPKAEEPAATEPEPETAGADDDNLFG